MQEMLISRYFEIWIIGWILRSNWGGWDCLGIVHGCEHVNVSSQSGTQKGMFGLEYLSGVVCFGLFS